MQHWPLLPILLFACGCAGASAPAAGDGPDTGDGSGASGNGIASGGAASSSGDVELLLLENVPGSEHEAVPHGVPLGYDWSTHATRGPLSAPEDAGFMNLWGQLYVDGSDTRPSNTRVEVRDCRLLVLPPAGAWQIAQRTDDLDGGAWLEDFSAQGPASAFDMRVEADGGRSFVTTAGHNAHFWPNLPYADVPDRLEAVIVVCATRLILADAAAPDDRAPPRYLLSVGADFRKPDGSCPNDICQSVGIGGFVHPGADWQLVVMSTMTEDDLGNFGGPPAEWFTRPEP
ncbi:MAG TPA: hypothetical protein VLC09_06095 [Polyangiaceae bacterium]|nr:hypothetical protein [Polyangiaceae bacterium]